MNRNTPLEQGLKEAGFNIDLNLKGIILRMRALVNEDQQKTLNHLLYDLEVWLKNKWENRESMQRVREMSDEELEKANQDLLEITSYFMSKF